MTYPKELLYTKSHEWVRVDGDVATVGLTHYAQDSLGDVVHYEPPSVGAKVDAGTAVAEIESVKAVSDVYAPVGGTVTSVNERLTGNPEIINEDPYGEGWMVKVKLSDPSEADQLMDAAAYRKLLDESD